MIYKLLNRLKFVTVYSLCHLDTFMLTIYVYIFFSTTPQATSSQPIPKIPSATSRNYKLDRFRQKALGIAKLQAAMKMTSKHQDRKTDVKSDDESLEREKSTFTSNFLFYKQNFFVNLVH